MDPIELIEVRTRSQLLEFIKTPHTIYRNDPCWVPPLILERKWHFDPKKNPFFEHADVQFFLARKNGQNVGTVSAHIDHNHNKQYGEKTGFFGFFESIEDPLVAQALIGTAQAWLKERGMNLMRGPMSFNVNDHCFLLVDGFNTPPFLLMTHNPPYYAGLLEGCGLEKVMDAYAWRYDILKDVPPAAMQLAEAVRSSGDIRIREIDMKHYDDEIAVFLKIYNSAWSENWGYIPMTPAEMQKMAEDLKLIMDRHLVLIAEHQGEPVAVVLALPNLNEAIRDLKGRLFPFGIFKLLKRMKWSKPDTARLLILGIDKDFRKSKKIKYLSVLLYVEIHERGRMLGYKWGELSWTLESNHRINQGISLMGGEKYKTYRVYQKAI